MSKLLYKRKDVLQFCTQEVGTMVLYNETKFCDLKNARQNVKTKLLPVIVMILTSQIYMWGKAK